MSGPGAAERGGSDLVVAEGMALLREGLTALLGQVWDRGVVRGAATLEEVLLQVSRNMIAGGAPGVLLLDLGLPGLGGVAGVGGLRARFPGLRIVVLSSWDTRDGMLECLAAGANGCVGRSSPASELIRAVSTVEAGGVHVPAAAEVEPVRLATPLTERQRDVLRLMAEGRSTKDIARTLDLAVSTIKVHLAAVYRATGARNRVEALCRTGLLPRAPLLR